MAEQGKKKKSKSKSKTVSLNEFLSGDGNTPPMPLRTKSWADETADLEDEELSTAWTDTQKPKPLVDMKSLPSAPRAATAPNIDTSRLPKSPPYTVFIGNLSYEASEDDVKKYFEKHHLNALSVRLVKDRDGRLKGFGYAEFESLQGLMDALSLKGTILKGRQVQVDVAEGRGDGGGGEERHSGRLRSDDDDRTSGNWRNSRDPSPPQPPRSYGYRNRSPSGQDYPDRGGYGQDRGRYGQDFRGYGRPREFRDRRDDRYSGSHSRYDSSPSRRRYSPPHRYNSPPPHSSQSSRDNHSPSSFRRPENVPANDRSPSPYRQNSPSSKSSPPPPRREDSYRNDRGPGQDRDRDYNRPPYRDDQYNGGDHRRYDDRPPRRDRPYNRDRDYDRGDRGYGRGRGGYDRGGYRDRRGFDRDYGDRRGFDRDYGDRGGRKEFGDYRGEHQSDSYRGRGRSPLGRQSPETREESPKERKKLQLQPRSKPIEQPVDSDQSTTSSIFGGAKPVDTAKKEREIEEKLKKKEIEKIQSRGGDTAATTKTGSGRRDSEGSEGGSRKESKRLPSEGDDSRNRGDRREERPRRNSGREEDQPSRREDGEPRKGRGRKDFKPRSDDDRKEERSGRGRKKDRRNVSQEEKPPTILKKHEEQKSVEITRTNRFAALDDDNVEEEEEEEKEVPVGQ